MAWLKKRGIDFSFHDYKQLGISKGKLEEWCNKLSWEAIFNKRSTTWREIPEAEQKKVVNQSAAIQLMLQNNSIIKRPVIEIDDDLVIGFTEKEIIKHLK